MKKLLVLGLCVAVLTGCSYKSADSISVNEDIVGHWKQENGQLEYIFYKDKNLLTILGTDNGGMECTYRIDKVDEEINTANVWFICPLPDYPGYAENHDLEFLSPTEFIDIGYMQGIPMGASKSFYKIGNRGSENLIN